MLPCLHGVIEWGPLGLVPFFVYGKEPGMGTQRYTCWTSVSWRLLCFYAICPPDVPLNELSLHCLSRPSEIPMPLSCMQAGHTWAPWALCALPCWSSRSTVILSTTELPGPLYQLPSLYLPGRPCLKVFTRLPAFAVRSILVHFVRLPDPPLSPSSFHFPLYPHFLCLLLAVPLNVQGTTRIHMLHSLEVFIHFIT